MAEALRRESPNLQEHERGAHRCRCAGSAGPQLFHISKGGVIVSHSLCRALAGEHQAARGCTFTVLSSEHERRKRPSFENVTQRTVPLCALMADDLPSLRGVSGASEARPRNDSCESEDSVSQYEVGLENSHSRKPETDRLVL